MQVQFKINLGSADAERLGVDFKKCTKGAKVDVSRDAAELLAKRGIVEVLEKKIAAVAKASEVTAPAPEPIVTPKHNKGDK